eukprot:6210982-Pleurochrysis_carterae.AAC.2
MRTKPDRASCTLQVAALGFRSVGVHVRAVQPVATAVAEAVIVVGSVSMRESMGVSMHVRAGLSVGVSASVGVGVALARRAEEVEERREEEVGVDEADEHERAQKDAEAREEDDGREEQAEARDGGRDDRREDRHADGRERGGEARRTVARRLGVRVRNVRKRIEHQPNRDHEHDRLDHANLSTG